MLYLRIGLLSAVLLGATLLAVDYSNTKKQVRGLKIELADARKQVTELRNLVKITEELLTERTQQETAVKEVVTRVVTKIKETPYEVPLSPDSSLPAELTGLLQEAYDGLHLRKASK